MFYLLGILSIILPHRGQGTLLNPSFVEEQLRKGHAVIHGIYNGSLGVKRSNTGPLLTEHSLSLFSVAGLEQHKIVNKRSYSFLTLGGQLGEEIQFRGIYVPFKKGDEVVVILKKGSRGLFMEGHILNKFSVVQKMGKKHLVNSAFPYHRDGSNFSFKEFNALVKKRFGSPLSGVDERQVFKKRPPKNSPEYGRVLNRSLASLPHKKKENNILPWPLFALGLLGLYCCKVMGKRR